MTKINDSDNLLQEVLAIKEKFDTLKTKYASDAEFSKKISTLLVNNGLDDEEKIKAEYKEAAEISRDLKIGIVGAVKAGKSSLLNALFFDGVDILPKAATPMTAALTELTYGETCKVTVDFFTDADIEKLKTNSEAYEQRLKELEQNNINEARTNWLKMKQRQEPGTRTKLDAKEKKALEERARNKAKQELSDQIELVGAHEQYQMIKNLKKVKSGSETFTLSSMNDIAGKLADYVGSEGKYMPFTSKVRLQMPIKALEGISVIDTPGFNDPIPSRDERARQALRECDVVLILSPARQFISKTDMSVMQKIRKKNGIRELYLIASQIDSQLYNPEYKELNGDLDNVISRIKEILVQTATRNLEQINYDGLFDTLRNEPDTRLFLSSGMCESMYRTFEKKDSWDEGRKHTWKSLTSDYHDYFSDGDVNTSKEWLKHLGNIEPITECIQKVKERKVEILNRKLSTFASTRKEAAVTIKYELLDLLDSKVRVIGEKNISDVEAEIKATERKYSIFKKELSDKLNDCTEEWYRTVKKDALSSLKYSKKTASDGIVKAKGSKTQYHTSGFWWWEKKYPYEVISANEGKIRTTIDDYIAEYNNEALDFIREETGNLSQKIADLARNTWQEFSIFTYDENDELALKEIASNARAIIGEIKFDYDTLKYTGADFSSSLSSTYYEPEKILSLADEFVSKLNREFTLLINDTLRRIVDDCKSCNFSSRLLDSYITKLEQRKRELEKPKLALETIKRMRSDVEKLNV